MQFRFLNLEYLFKLVYDYLSPGNISETLPEIMATVIFWVKVVSIIITPFLFVAVIILLFKISKLRAVENKDMEMALFERQRTSSLKNEKWEKILHYLGADNPAEWKLAIIEADNMLDEVIRQLRPVGDNLGERLKSIAPGDLLTLDDAWEAHKIRNRIAHEMDFILTKQETRKTIEHYKRVFEELEYI